MDSKRIFFCTLQNMEVLTFEDDLDMYVEHDIITLIDNGFDNDDFQSDNE